MHSPINSTVGTKLHARRMRSDTESTGSAGVVRGYSTDVENVSSDVSFKYRFTGEGGESAGTSSTK